MQRHRQPKGRRSRRAAAGLCALALALGGLVGLAGPATPAQAAAAGVGNGLTTTDLSAVGMTPAGLASSLVGPGVTVSNVTYSGASAQAGLIHLVDPAVVSFNDGVILSSGNIADVVGPNKSDGITGDMAGPADPDLNALIANTQTVNPVTFDAASLEFDFVPSASQVYFTYTFGSDEYLEWVNLFNDVFAFYVNGQNCATVPNGDPVSIDTINSSVNPNLFRDNSYSSPPPNPINIESDGLSVEMICSAPVQAGQVNHLKLAIADTSDQILDSVVMIKAHSLSTTAPESCNDHVDNDDDGQIDDADSSCQATTTPPPPGGGGIGSDGSAPPFTGNEGTPIPLDAAALGWTATPDTIATTWTVTGINGTPGSCEVTPAGPMPVGPGGAIAVPTAICPNEGEYVARVDGWDAEGGGSFDTDVDFFVHNAPPAVAIDAPQQGAQVGIGAPVALSASVTDPGVADAVTCSIDWGDGTSEPGVLADGSCTGSHAFTGPGSSVISVTATDDAGDSSAAATVVNVTSLPATTTGLTSNLNPAVKGQPVTLRATVTAPAGTGVPTGTVELRDDGVLVASKALSKGVATIVVRPAAGVHHYTATYLGSAVHAASPASAPVEETVVPAATTTVLTSKVNPSVSGQAVTLLASVKAVAPGAGGPSGTVTLYEGGVPVASKFMKSGSISFSVRPKAGSAHLYTAAYDGSGDYLASATVAGLDQVVERASTKVTLVSPYPTTTYGHAGSLVATVSTVAPGSGVPTGTITFADEGGVLAVVPVVSGKARLPIAVLSRGVHTIVAGYDGDFASLPSSSTPLVQTIT